MASEGNEFVNPDPAVGGCGCDGTTGGDASGGGHVFAFHRGGWWNWDNFKALEPAQKFLFGIQFICDVVLILSAIAFIVIFFVLIGQAAMGNSTDATGQAFVVFWYIFAITLVVTMLIDALTNRKDARVQGVDGFSQDGAVFYPPKNFFKPSQTQEGN